jgi:hypothetical protein
VAQVAIGFLLMVAVAYAALALDERMKMESQKQSLISVGEYAAARVVSAMEYLQPGQSASAEYRLPLSRDYYAGQYSLGLEDIGGAVYVRVQSVKWPGLVSRQPLFLSRGVFDGLSETPTFPPGLCVNASRSLDGLQYNLSVNCLGQV